MTAFTFKTNTADLREWLKKRKASLEQARFPIESQWRDIRLNFEPFLGKALIEGDPNTRSAEREDEKILNSEPRTLLHRMGAGLQSGITNQARSWFKLNCMDKQLTELSHIRKWLDDATEIVQAAMNRSNFYPAFHLEYIHLAQFGTACGLVVPDSENIVHIHVIDAGAYWIAENRRGRVDTLLRRMDMTIANLVEEFGEGWLPEAIKEKVKAGQLEERVIVWNLVCRHDPKRIKDIDEKRAFASVYWLDVTGEAANDGIIAIRSYGYNPIIAPRWAVFGSAYGVGCGMIGLADAKQLQVLELDKLKLVAAEVNPAMQAPASMKSTPIDTGPGGLTFYPDSIGGSRDRSPVTRLFETREQIAAILLTIDAVEKRLGKTFFTDLFAMMINLNMAPKPQTTAREVNELSSERVALLGPVLTRLNVDMLDTGVDAVFALCAEAGALPPAPPELIDVALRIEYVSSLHVDQLASTRMGGLFKLSEFVAALAQLFPSITDKVDVDEMVDIAAGAFVEHGVVRDDKAVAAIRQARADQQAQALKAEQIARAVPAMAGAAKDLSQTKMDQGSALDGILVRGGAQ